MFGKVSRILSWVAEQFAVLMLALIFVAFVLQIALRYLFNWPVGWTSEISVVAWLWLILFGTGFVLKDSEELRIDFIYANVGRRLRLVMGIVGSVLIAILLARSFLPSWDYISFMKVEKASYLKIRFDWLYSIYLAFIVALVVRHVVGVVRMLRGHDPLKPDTQAHTAL